MATLTRVKIALLDQAPRVNIPGLLAILARDGAHVEIAANGDFIDANAILVVD